MPWSGELLIPRSERELRRSEGSGKLINDPLVEGSNAGSTNRASDLLQSSGGVKLTEGTVSTDLLVAYTPLFLDPAYMGQGSGAQGTSRGFNQLKEGTKLCA